MKEPFVRYGKLDPPVPRGAFFGAPQDVRNQGGAGVAGTIVDEIWADDSVNAKPPRTPTGTNDWGDYSFYAQRIEWADGTRSIRLGYWRRPAGKDFWQHGSQTTVNTEPITLKKLLEAVLAKDAWFS